MRTAISTTFGFEDVPLAFERLRTGAALGRISVVLGDVEPGATLGGAS